MILQNSNSIKEINAYIDKTKTVLDNIDKQEIVLFIQVLMDAYYAEKQIFVMGNGGSASTASHFVCDINKGVSYGLDKKFKMICLNDNIPIMLAYSNDTNYEEVFVEQLKNYLNEDDVVIGISGSGNSKNIIRSIEYANSKNVVTAAITGFDGGILKKIAKYSVNSNIDDMHISEDIHMILVHITMKILCSNLNSKQTACNLSEIIKHTN